MLAYLRLQQDIAWNVFMELRGDVTHSADVSKASEATLALGPPPSTLKAALCNQTLAFYSLLVVLRFGRLILFPLRIILD